MAKLSDLPTLRIETVKIDGVEVQIRELDADAYKSCLGHQGDYIEQAIEAAFHGALNGTGRLFPDREAVKAVRVPFVQKLAEEVMRISGMFEDDEGKAEGGES